MKVILIQPPIQDFYDTQIRLHPIGLCYLKAMAYKFHPDIPVTVRDYHHNGKRKTIPIPRELTHLKKYWNFTDKSPFCGFHQYYHFGDDFNKIVDDIFEENFDLIGISSLFSPYYREVLTLAKLIKMKSSFLGVKKTIFLGGSHINSMPEFMLSNADIDYVIKGEGEIGFCQFLDYLKGHRKINEVQGLGYKIDKKLHFNSKQIKDQYYIENIDDYPYPDISDMPINNYLYKSKPMCFLITSRSCPHRCSFCSVHQTFGENYRYRSIPNIIEEIKYRYKQGIRVIDFEDDNLTYYKASMKQLCREIISLFPNKEMEFVAMNGISYLGLDEELLILMRQANFTQLNLALVTSDKLVQQATKRPHTVEKYIDIVEKGIKYNFSITSYQIIGLPQETLESMIQTMAFNANMPVLLGASMFYLTPNSPIAKNFPQRTEDQVFKARLTAMDVQTPYINQEQIYTLFMTTRIINFIKSLINSNSKCLMDLLYFDTLLESRDKIGVEILKKLFEEKILYYWNGKTYLKNYSFHVDLFFKVFKQMDGIKNMTGQRIKLEQFI